jgi:hypothetical protein
MFADMFSMENIFRQTLEELNYGKRSQPIYFIAFQADISAIHGLDPEMFHLKKYINRSNMVLKTSVNCAEKWFGLTR